MIFQERVCDKKEDGRTKMEDKSEDRRTKIE